VPHAADQPNARVFLEFGIAMRTGPGAFKADLPKVLADETNDLTLAMRELLGTSSRELGDLETRIARIRRKNRGGRDALGTGDATYHHSRHRSLSATAILAAVGDGKQFAKARDLAAWLGLVPAQYSTGGKSNLLRTSSAATHMCDACSFTVRGPAYYQPGRQNRAPASDRATIPGLGQ
jgi:transposase